MSAEKRYVIHVVPRSGKTLAKRTEQEWGLGYQFKVVGSDLLSIPRHSIVTSDELRTLAYQQDIEFEIKFSCQSIKEHVREQSAASYGFEQAFKGYSQ
jgi:hypothetical protein